MKVLVVDDSEIVLEVVGDFLKHLKLEPKFAFSFDEAKEKIEKENFDTLITDFYLDSHNSSKNGDQLCKLAKEKGIKKVIIMSGRELRELEFLAKSAGADGFLEKPFRIADVENLLELN